MPQYNIIEDISDSFQLASEHACGKIYVSIYSGFVYSQWKATPSLDKIMVGVNSELDILQKHNLGKLLIDTRDIRGVCTSPNWILNDWWPRAIDLGLKKNSFYLCQRYFCEVFC